MTSRDDAGSMFFTLSDEEKAVVNGDEMAELYENEPEATGASESTPNANDDDAAGDDDRSLDREGDQSHSDDDFSSRESDDDLYDRPDSNDEYDPRIKRQTVKSKAAGGRDNHSANPQNPALQVPSQQALNLQVLAQQALAQQGCPQCGTQTISQLDLTANLEPHQRLAAEIPRGPDNNPTRYEVAPKGNPGDPLDVTSFIPEQAYVSESNIPFRLGLLEQPTVQPGRRVGEFTHPITGRKLCDLPILGPRNGFISSKVEGWRADMWRSYDPRVQNSDIINRFRTLPDDYKQTSRNLTQHMLAWRTANAGFTLRPRNLGVDRVRVQDLQALESGTPPTLLSEDQLLHNTIWTLEHDQGQSYISQPGGTWGGRWPIQANQELSARVKHNLPYYMRVKPLAGSEDLGKYLKKHPEFVRHDTNLKKRKRTLAIKKGKAVQKNPEQEVSDEESREIESSEQERPTRKTAKRQRSTTEGSPKPKRRRLDASSSQGVPAAEDELDYSVLRRPAHHFLHPTAPTPLFYYGRDEPTPVPGSRLVPRDIVNASHENLLSQEYLRQAIDALSTTTTTDQISTINSLAQIDIARRYYFAIRPFRLTNIPNLELDTSTEEGSRQLHNDSALYSHFVQQMASVLREWYRINQGSTQNQSSAQRQFLDPGLPNDNMRFGENENRWPTGSNWGSLYSEGPQYQGNGAFPAGSASASLSSQGYNGPQWHASPGSWQTGGNNAVRGAGASASSAHFSSSLYAYSYPAGGQIPNNVGNQQRGSRDRYSTSEHDDDQDQDQDQGGGGDTTN